MHRRPIHPDHKGHSLGLTCAPTAGTALQILFLLAIYFLQGVGLACGKEVPSRLLDQQPFDQITLNERNKRAVLKILPLDVPNREWFTGFRRGEKIVLELCDHPGKQYELLVEHVAEVKLFEQLLLDEAQAFVDQERFDLAYENYTYLHHNQPNLRGLRQAVEDYLIKNAAFAFRNNDYEVALARLLEVREQNPNRNGLPVLLSRVADKLIERHVRNKKFPAALGILTTLKKTDANQQAVQAVLTRWEQRFSGRARKVLKRADQHFEKKEYSQAYQLCRQALAIWPSLTEAHELAADIEGRFFQVVVGVTWPYDPAATTDRLDNWAWRRVRRLISRPLVEVTGISSQGLQYHCPYGELEETEDGRQLLLKLRSNLAWSRGPGAPSGLDLSNSLLTRAKSGSPTYNPDWATIFSGVSVRNLNSVIIDLRRAHVQPEALLQIGISAPDSTRPADFGPYTIQKSTARQTSFVLSDATAPAVSRPPHEIIEIACEDSTEAVEGLRRGDLMILERVAPWDLPKVRALADVVTERYAFPSLHVLIPNPRQPVMANRAFRRAIEYGIHRTLILQQDLLAGQTISGCVPLGGPFPVATALDDSLGYATNTQIELRSYEPHLAYALAQGAMRELAAQASDPSESDEPQKDPEEKHEFPVLTLAHPAEPVARQASLAISQHLGRIGIKLELKELSVNELIAGPEDYDLLYAELAMWEPAVDARRLLGSDELPTHASPYLSLALRQLATAGDSQQIRRKLHEIHALAQSDLTVIPLWQLVDHFAYRRNLQGLGTHPATLYQNVERWSLAPHSAVTP